jgi:hypothetical protein
VNVISFELELMGNCFLVLLIVRSYRRMLPRQASTRVGSPVSAQVHLGVVAGLGFLAATSNRRYGCLMTCNALREVSLFAALMLLGAVAPVQADQVVMQNNDHYNGKVLSVTTNALVLQSDILGTVTLPRGKVAVITMSSEAATNASRLAAVVPSRAPAVLKTNAASELSAQVRQLGSQTNLLQQVQSQFLAAASPEANARFNRMVNDLATGRMDINSLRTQAQSAAAQLRSLEKEAGADDSGTLDIYLSILDKFLKESAPPPNASGPPKSSPAAAQEEE